MPTQAEEQQAKEFLKRAEIRTMRKDLAALREVDALKERDKIAKLRTLEEQLQEQQAKAEKEREGALAEKAAREEVLEQNESQQKIAEKDLKNYATEEERQQIFLFESQRFDLEKQSDAIDKEKDPALKLEKNKVLLQKREQQKKLDAILEEERKMEGEQKFLAEKANASAIASQRKALEQERWDMDKKIQEVEKKRWEAEKQVQDTDAQLMKIDDSLDKLVTEKNELRGKILGIDKSLRGIYSGVMAREEEKRRGQAQEQVAQKEALAKLRAEQKEKIQRQQWKVPGFKQQETEGYLGKVPSPVKKRILETAQSEEEQRKKFMQDVEMLSQTGSTGHQEEKEKKSSEPSILSHKTNNKNISK